MIGDDLDDILNDPELRRLFLEDCRKGLEDASERLKALVAGKSLKENGEKLRIFAHRLAGSGGTYGYDEAGAAAQRLSELLKGSAVKERKMDISLISETSRILEEIRDLLKLN